MCANGISGGRSNLLERRIAWVPISSLSSGQIEIDQITNSFASSTCDWRTLTAMSLGGLSFRLGKLASIRLSGAFANGVGLFSEVATFRSAEAILRRENLSGAFERKAFLSTALDFALLKGAGNIVQGQNIFFAHAIQSGTMVLGHDLGASLHLVEREEGSLAKRWMMAEATNLQMMAGMNLMGVATGNRFTLWEHALKLQSETLHEMRQLQRLSDVRIAPREFAENSAFALAFTSGESLESFYKLFSSMESWIGDHKLASLGIGVGLGLFIFRNVKKSLATRSHQATVQKIQLIRVNMESSFIQDHGEKNGIIRIPATFEGQLKTDMVIDGVPCAAGSKTIIMAKSGGLESGTLSRPHSFVFRSKSGRRVIELPAGSEVNMYFKDAKNSLSFAKLPQPIELDGVWLAANETISFGEDGSVHSGTLARDHHFADLLMLQGSSFHYEANRDLVIYSTENIEFGKTKIPLLASKGRGDNAIVIQGGNQLKKGTLSRDFTFPNGVRLPAKSTFELDPEENPTRVTLSANATVNEIPLKQGSLDFHLGGKVTGVLSHLHTFPDGITLPSETHFMLNASGKLEAAMNVSQTLIQGVPCEGLVHFKNGKVQSGALGADHTFNNIPFPKDSHFKLDDTGQALSVTLRVKNSEQRKSWRIGDLHYPSDTVFHFENGKLREADSSSSLRGGIWEKSGEEIFPHPNNKDLIIPPRAKVYFDAEANPTDMQVTLEGKVTDMRGNILTPAVEGRYRINIGNAKPSKTSNHNGDPFESHLQILGLGALGKLFGEGGFPEGIVETIKEGVNNILSHPVNVALFGVSIAIGSIFLWSSRRFWQTSAEIRSIALQLMPDEVNATALFDIKLNPAELEALRIKTNGRHYVENGQERTDCPLTEDTDVVGKPFPAGLILRFNKHGDLIIIGKLKNPLIP